jgi:phage/conjugal plasmid C-4 type zinc finger TraR family protein
LIDDIDRAQAREAEILGDALRDQERRAGLVGKTVADSAEVCQARGCGEAIAETRRRAVPGVQLCVACQGRREKKKGMR